eukprot:5466196-Prymnesium_polylepis.1
MRWSALPDAAAAPPPRWNPTLVLAERAACLVTFGGYNGSRKFNDVACFCLDQRRWAHPEAGALAPPPMTDHAAAVVRAA